MDYLDDASDGTSLVRGKAFIDYMRESLVGRKFGEFILFKYLVEKKFGESIDQPKGYCNYFGESQMICQVPQTFLLYGNNYYVVID